MSQELIYICQQTVSCSPEIALDVASVAFSILFAAFHMPSDCSLMLMLVKTRIMTEILIFVDKTDVQRCLFINDFGSRSRYERFCKK